MRLRFVISASLIAFGSIIGVSALALFLPVSERPRVPGTEIPDAPASLCERQAWLNLDRNCLSRRDLPWVAGQGTSRPVVVEAPPAAEDVREQPSTERQRTARAPLEPASDMTAPERSSPVPPPAVAEQRIAKPAIESQVAPPPRNAAAERHVAKPVIASQVAPAPPKKVVRSGRAARRPTDEALKTVRRFGGETLHDIPVSAYAADGTRRSIVIRPTSVQDVYYYSVPR